MRRKLTLGITALTVFLLVQSTSSECRSQNSVSEGFPLASAASQGMSEESLRALTNVVRGYVERDEIVGAELLVIKNRHVVLHETFGWRNREQKLQMERNTIFNVRSMTKPLTGMAAQMLIDDGRLRLKDGAATHLKSFANDKCRDITVEHLLTHRSGLPLTFPLQETAGETPATVLRKYSSQTGIVDLIAERGPETGPGRFFQYSDAGSEVLGAIVSQVSGQPLGEFVRDRILVPLGMKDAMMPLDTQDPRARRASSAYFGVPKNWLPYWRPDSVGIYPFAMGSQSLYCTPMDYARFLAVWLDEGVVDGERILSVEAIRRALKPVSDMQDYGTGFPGLEVKYGQMWMLYVPKEGLGAPEPVIFGHGGSDGTVAWVWPRLDLMILYFTQNRGTLTSFSLEREIDRLIINPSSAAAPPVSEENLESYAGAYALKSQASELFLTTVKNGKLMLETPSGATIDLLPPDADGVWHFSVAPSQGVMFGAEVRDSARSMWIVDPLQLRLSDETPAERDSGDSSVLRQYVGTYVLPSSLGQGVLKYRVVEEGGRLIFKSQQGSRFELKSPDGRDRWYLKEWPKAYLTFQRDTRDDVTGCSLYQMHECVRTVAPASHGLTAAEARKYAGRYYDATANLEVEVIYENGSLAVKHPSLPSPVALRATGTPGTFSVPISPSVSVRFNEDATGNVISQTVVTPNGEFDRPRVK